ncbi:MAG: hypothetical protein LC130_27220 [Bryobacterales bacterium]|nr:hypothetical protein [Bryobacterales bacterium]
MTFEKIDQCRATTAIKNRFGRRRARSNYLIREKLLNVAEAAERPLSSTRVPRFLPAARRIFDQYEIAKTEGRRP